MSVADLTGTSWKFGNTLLTKSNSPSTYNVNGTVNNDSAFEFTGGFKCPLANYSHGGVLINRYFYDITQESDGSWVDYNNDDGYVASELGNEIVVSFTGGTDATNATLISWLEANATNVTPAPTPSGNTYEITHSLSHVTAGTFTIHIEPDTGYTYPASVTVTNGTLVSYDSTTGTVVFEGDDTTVVEAECVAVTPSGYQVTLSTSGLSSAVDIYDGQNSGGSLLGSRSPIETKTFSITSGFIYADESATFYYGMTGKGNPCQITEDIALTLTGGSND